MAYYSQVEDEIKAFSNPTLTISDLQHYTDPSLYAALVSNPSPVYRKFIEQSAQNSKKQAAEFKAKIDANPFIDAGNSSAELTNATGTISLFPEGDPRNDYQWTQFLEEIAQYDISIRDLELYDPEDYKIWRQLTQHEKYAMFRKVLNAMGRDIPHTGNTEWDDFYNNLGGKIDKFEDKLSNASNKLLIGGAEAAIIAIVAAIIVLKVL